MMQRFLNTAFPVSGGTIGAITQVPEVASAIEVAKAADPSHMHIILETVLVAFIGAMVGYIVKKLLDYLWPHIFKYKVR